MEILEEEAQKNFVEFLQKNKLTQTSGSVFADRMEQVKKSEFELEPRKFVGYFLDHHGNFIRNLVSFKV